MNLLRIALITRCWFTGTGGWTKVPTKYEKITVSIVLCSSPQISSSFHSSFIHLEVLMLMITTIIAVMVNVRKEFNLIIIMLF